MSINAMLFKFHGGAGEVGRSCIELVTQKENRFILDAGLKFLEGGFKEPEKIFEYDKIDALIISHPHEDHIGALPIFEHKKIHCPIFCTELTKRIGKIMLLDSFKIARIKHLHPAYQKIDLKKVFQDSEIVAFNRPRKYLDIEFEFKNAGHVPGSAITKINVDEKQVIYSGDFRTSKSELMVPANAHGLENSDVLIIESTYGNRLIQDRDEVIEEFLNTVERIINQGGSVVVPVFALGRAQEILMILAKRKWKVPIFFDGMGRKIAHTIFDSQKDYIRDPDLFAKAYEGCELVASQDHRNAVAQQQGIFVTTSGMVQGGPAIHYIKHMWHNTKSAILLTGYQAKRTNGRMLQQERALYIKGWRTEVQCEVHNFPFSGHSDQHDLIKFIQQVNPKHLIIQHGDKEASADLKQKAEELRMQCEMYTPEVGDEIQIP